MLFQKSPYDEKDEEETTEIDEEEDTSKNES